ncbi:MAG: HAMP domain-containing protein [Planctomycetes bacterium]|nr:HAMP domain-containing protein [Planctomycetota bacterium]
MIPTPKSVLGIRGIVAGALALTCIGVNVLGILYVSREHKLIERTMTAMTTQQGELWAQLCTEAFQSEDIERLQAIVGIIGTSEHIVQAQVLDSNGLVVAARTPDAVGSMRPAGDTEHGEFEASGFVINGVRELHPVPSGFFHEEGHDFEFQFPLVQDGRSYGSLVLVMNTAWGNRQAKALAITGMVTLFAITLAIVLLAILLDWRLRGAVKQLIAATQAIAHGQLDLEVSVGTHDELDVLGESVTQMAHALKHSQERVQHWEQQLENTIDQRTKELEESQALLAQQEKMAALGLMAAGIAHEVGNPLAALSTILQRMEMNAPPEVGKKCEIMKQQIDRISRIIHELRQFSRPVSHAEDVPVNLNDVLRQSVQVCRYDPRAKNIQIEDDFDPNLPSIKGNPDRWQQVFLNIIINAFDAMPKGGQLSVISRSVNGLVELCFRDTGVGMTSEQMRKLFHPFFSTKRSGQRFGLGLSVCEGIVRSSGGSIEVSSQPGRGTEFRITIPTHRADSDLPRANPLAGGAHPSIAQRSLK